MCLLVLTLLTAVLVPMGVAHAQDGDPPEEAASNLVAIFTALGRMAVRVIYALIAIVFAVGTVKSGLAAQAAQAFGATGRVSFEMMNMVGGIVIFAIAIMALPLANMVIDEVTAALFGGSSSLLEIHNPFSP
jgi:hypothetical protein